MSTPTVTDIVLPLATDVTWLTSDGQVRSGAHDTLDRSIPLVRLRYQLTLPGKDGKHLAGSTNVFSLCDSRERAIRHHQIKPDGRLIQATTSASPVVGITPAYLFGVDVEDTDKNLYGMYATYDAGEHKMCIYGYNNVLFSMINSGECTPFTTRLGFEYIAIGDYHGLVTVYKWRFQKSLTYKTFMHPKFTRFRKHRRAVSSISMTERLLVTGSWDGCIAIYELGEDRHTLEDKDEAQFEIDQPYVEYVCTRRVMKQPHRIHTTSACDVRNSSTHDGDADDKAVTMIAASGDDCVVHVWRYMSDEKVNKTARLVPVISFSHHSSVRAVSFSPCASTLASGCYDSSVRLMSIPSHSSTMEHMAFEKERNKYKREHEAKLSFDSAWLTPRTGGIMRLVYVKPRQMPPLNCPMCSADWTRTAIPMVCGRCNDVIGCVQCMQRLGLTDKTHGTVEVMHEQDKIVPCPLCKVEIFTEDIVPHHDFVAQMEKRGLKEWIDDPGYQLIDASRLQFQSDDSMVLTRRHSCVLLQGMIDEQPVLIRYPRGIDLPTSLAFLSTGLTRQGDSEHWKVEAVQHVGQARRMHAPFINTHFGVCLHGSSSDALISVDEMPSGGTLEQNIESMSNTSFRLSLNTFVTLALQLSQAVRSVHQHDAICGHSLLPSCIGLSRQLDDEHLLASVKLLEFGGFLSASRINHNNYCIPHDFLPYAGPELVRRAESTATDVYALGIILWYMATFVKPNSDVIRSGVEQRPDINRLPRWMPGELVALIGSMWATNPDQRPNIDSVIEKLSNIPTAPLPPLAIAVQAHGASFNTLTAPDIITELYQRERVTHEHEHRGKQVNVQSPMVAPKEYHAVVETSVRQDDEEESEPDITHQLYPEPTPM